MSKGTKGVIGAGALLHRVENLATGVDKHAGEPGFPELFATIDLHAAYDELAGAVSATKEAQTLRKDLMVSVRARGPQMRELYDRAIAAVESWCGPESPILSEFGARPRKGPYSGKTKRARAARKAAKKRKAAKAAAAGGSGSTPAATGGGK